MNEDMFKEAFIAKMDALFWEKQAIADHKGEEGFRITTGDVVKIALEIDPTLNMHNESDLGVYGLQLLQGYTKHREEREQGSH